MRYIAVLVCLLLVSCGSNPNVIEVTFGKKDFYAFKRVGRINENSARSCFTNLAGGRVINFVSFEKNEVYELIQYIDGVHVLIETYARVYKSEASKAGHLRDIDFSNNVFMKKSQKSYEVKFCGIYVGGELTPIASVKIVNDPYKLDPDEVARREQLKQKIIKMAQDKGLSCPVESQRRVLHLIGSVSNPKSLDLYCENEDDFYSYGFEKERIRQLKRVTPYYSNHRWLYWYPPAWPMVLLLDGLGFFKVLLNTDEGIYLPIILTDIKTTISVIGY